LVIKIKPSGDTLWTKTFRQTDSPIQINIQQNGSILLFVKRLGYFSNQMISIININTPIEIPLLTLKYS